MQYRGKQGCPLSCTIFGIYIDKLEECLETAGCQGTELGDIINILLILFFLQKSMMTYTSNLRLLMPMRVNTHKTKFMIIKTKKTTHGSFSYDNHCLEEVSSYKYLGIDFSQQLNSNYNIEKMLNYSIKKRIIGGWKDYYELENNCKSTNICICSKTRFLFET